MKEIYILVPLIQRLMSLFLIFDVYLYYFDCTFTLVWYYFIISVEIANMITIASKQKERVLMVIQGADKVI